jgi:YYY domain-containing protein
MSPDLLAFVNWYLVVTACGLLALPLAFKFFHRLPDRGYAFAKPLGLLTVFYVFWFFGSLGFLRNDAAGMLFAGACVGGLGAWWLGREGFSELGAWLREQAAAALAVELLFLAAFALMAYVRAHNPEILGTEKPMEFMFINSILRSPAFPPHDAWLSGHAISYYYFGYVMVASLARFTGTAASVAFNLGLALLFALTAVGSLGVVMNLIALVKKDEGGRTKDELHPSSFILLPSFWPSLLGPLLVLVAGNFYGPLALAHRNGMFADLDVPAIRYSFGAPGASGSPHCFQDAASQPGLRAGWINFWDWLDLKELRTPLPTAGEKFKWDMGPWFYAARVVHDCSLTGAETEAIDEMPAFSFLLGDMHPHVLALPFVVLAIGLALEWLLDAGDGWRVTGDGVSLVTSRSTPSEASGRHSSLVTHHSSLVTRHFSLVTPDRLLLSSLLLGGLSFLNTWDFPIYWFLTTVAFVCGLGLRWGWGELLKRWKQAGLTALALAALSVALYLPFYLTFQSQAGGILPNLIYPTRFQQTLVFFGPVLVGTTIFLAWLTGRGRDALDRGVALWAGAGIVALLVLAGTALAVGASFNKQISAFADQVIAPLTRDQALRLTLQRRLVDSLATLFPALVIGLSIGLGVGLLRQTESAQPEPQPELPAPEKPRPWRKRSPSTLHPPLSLRSPAILMSLAMTLTGALLLIGPEYVYLRDNFGSRMNTIFKFYFQTWTLWALVSAFGVWLVARYAGGVGKWISVAAMGLAIAGGLLYTLPAVNTKTGGFAGPPTLDGMAYFARDYPDDWAAIQWLQQNESNAPVILEGTRGAYWGEGRSSRISMATGLPTVMGWMNHEGQWRGKYFERVAGRGADIETIYQVRDWGVTRELLDKYQVKYVVVSSLERGWYNPVYTPKFDQNMVAVFQSGDVTIYRRQDSQP